MGTFRMKVRLSKSLKIVMAVANYDQEIQFKKTWGRGHI